MVLLLYNAQEFGGKYGGNEPKAKAAAAVRATGKPLSTQTQFIFLRLKLAIKLADKGRDAPHFTLSLESVKKSARLAAFKRKFERIIKDLLAIS